MEDVRPFERKDLAAVTALIGARLPGWRWGESLLVDTLFEHPWADPDLPSLVALDEREQVIGFFGAQVRRMRLDGRRLRGVCCSHLVVASDRPVGLAGTLLVRKMLSGAQDLSWTDSATDDVVRIWSMFGGYLDYTRACDWMLVLRPGRWLGAIAAAFARRRELNRALVPVGALPFQAAGPRLARAAFPAPSPEVRGEQVTLAELVDEMPSMTKRMRLYVDYDRPQLDRLFAQVGAAIGAVSHRVVRRSGSSIGWYAYVAQPGGVVRVLHVLAPDADIDAVVGELVEHARDEGGDVLTGRAEPHLRKPLLSRFAVMGYSRQPVIHTRNPEIREVLGTNSSLLTTLDGEWFTT